eukprot:365632-Chlamydomonas_euryale.AAC.14
MATSTHHVPATVKPATCEVRIAPLFGRNTAFIACTHIYLILPRKHAHLADPPRATVLQGGDPPGWGSHPPLQTRTSSSSSPGNRPPGWGSPRPPRPANTHRARFHRTFAPCEGLIHPRPANTHRALFHRAFAPCGGLIQSKVGVLIFHRKGGAWFGNRLPYRKSVQPSKAYSIAPWPAVSWEKPRPLPQCSQPPDLASDPTRGARLALQGLSCIHPKHAQLCQRAPE